MDLSPYSLTDIDAACKEIGYRRREEGETAFPDLATLLEAIRAVVRSRKPEDAAAERWLAYLEAVKAEGTQEPDAEIEKRIAALNARMGV